MRLLISLKAMIVQRRSGLLIACLYGAIAIALLAPMASSSTLQTTGDNEAHLAYTIQARMALDEGQFPLRIAPYEAHGWRYPGFQFYSQIPYLLGGLIYKYVTPGDPYFAYKFVLWLSLSVAAFYIYRLCFWLTLCQQAAILAGATYMAAPYFLVNIHARAAFTEVVAQGILPIVLYYTIRCYASRKLLYVVMSGIAWFALATTHLITFIYSSLFIGLFLLLLRPTRREVYLKRFSYPVETRRSRLIRVGIGYSLGWLLALYFLAPVVLESGNLAVNKFRNPYSTNWMTSLAILLSPVSMPPVPNQSGIVPTYGNNPAIGLLLLSAWGVVAYYRISSQSWPNRLRHTRYFVAPLLWVFILAVFATWSPFNFWNLLPRALWVIQFTFRILTQAMWTGALLSAYAIVLLFEERLDRRHLVLGLLLILMLNSSWLPLPRAPRNVSELVKEPEVAHSGALDYLNRTEPSALYGKTELPLLPNNWTPGYDPWDIINNNYLPLSIEQRLPVWSPFEKPVLQIDGVIPAENLNGRLTLSVFVNDQRIAQNQFSSGFFSWRLPFENIPTFGKTFRLKIVPDANTKNSEPINIIVKAFNFEGLSPEHTVIPVSITQQACFQKGTETVCQVSTLNDSQVVQLPVLYYPWLLKVLVNGKEVKYFATSYSSYNLTSLQLAPGNYTISVFFVGLSWANWLSLLAWLGVISALINLLVVKRFNKGNNQLDNREKQNLTGA